MTQEERKEVKSKCGQLLWVSNNSRPDIAYETSTLSLCNPGKNAVVEDILKVNKLILKLKQTKGVVKYPDLGCPEDWSIKVYSDSSYANLPDGSSQGGFVIFLSSSVGKVAPICWQYKKLHSRLAELESLFPSLAANTFSMSKNSRLAELESLFPSLAANLDSQYFNEENSRLAELESLFPSLAANLSSLTIFLMNEIHV